MDSAKGPMFRHMVCRLKRGPRETIVGPLFNEMSDGPHAGPIPSETEQQ